MLKWVKAFAVAALAVTLSHFSALGEGLTGAHSDYVIDSWQGDDGLPQNSVIALAQTADGFLWLSTFEGLARFDGKRFEIFDEDQYPELSDEVFTSLDSDSAGNLWLRDRFNRLFLRREGHFRRLGKDDGVIGITRALEMAPDGQVWIGDVRGSLSKWDGHRFQVAMATPPTPDWGYYTMEIDAAGRPWLCSSGRLARLENGQWQRMLEKEKASEFGLMHRMRDGSMGLVTAGHQSKLVRYTDNGTSVVDTIPGDVRGYFLTEDPDGCLWISTSTGILRREPNGRWSELTRANGLPADPVRSELVDREGNRWFGTAGGGLVRLKHRLGRRFGVGEGMSQKVALSVLADKPDSAWVAVLMGGLNHFDGTHFSQLTTAEGLNADSAVWCATVTRDRSIWCGTYGGRLFHLDPDGKHLHLFSQTNTPMIGGPIKALMESRNGDLWFGGDGGICHYTGGQFQSFTTNNGLVDNTVTSIAEDTEGAIWAGTPLGLDRIMGTNIQTFTVSNGLAGNSVRSLFRDSRGSVWIGGHELTRLRQGKFHTVTTREGLPVNNIRGIIEDDLDHLWFATTRGILRASRDQLDACCEGEPGQVEFSVYNKTDGLPADECSGSQPGVCKSKDGRLWFATIDGLAVIDPQHLPRNTLPPQVVIEGIVADDKPLLVPEGQTNGVVHVPAGTSRLEFRFAALSFRAPEKNRFRYRLDGYEEEWSEASTSETASYTRLPPATYHFHVSACNNDGVWNPTDISLAVALAPFFWQTAWFHAAVAVAGAALFYLIFNYRLAQAEKRRLAQEAFARQLIAAQETERKRIAHELHDGVGQSLILAKNHIAGTIAKADPTSVLIPRLAQISTEVSQALEEIRATSRALRPVELDRLGLAKSLEAMIERATAGTAVTALPDLDDLEKTISREVEIQLYRIAQEAINNVLKHSNARRVMMELKREGECVRLTVQDNGSGFDPARGEGRNGFGLAGMAERARLIGGDFAVKAEPGSGCRVTVSVPVAG